VKKLIVCAVALAVLGGCATQSTSPIATVDVERIQANWPKFINYSNQLSSDTAAIQRSSDSPRRKQQELDQLRQRYVSMQNDVTGDVRSAVQEVANEKHFQMVVTRQFVGYGGTDITADVEKILKITEASPTGS
jgi:Skp family chaperone for outer membrane proteins